MKRTYPILLILFVLWMCIGIFPLQCYETDGLEIIFGCDIMYNEGWSFPPIYSYEYRMQPLITILVVALKHLLPFLTCEQIYCILTAVASVVFLLGCITFAQHVTKVSKTKILVAAMLLPEMYAIAMYANTAILSVACFLWALIFISKERYWLSGVLMCLSILFRLDIVIVFPVILVLFYYEGKTLKQTISLTAIIGLAVVIAALFFFWLMGADALRTVDGYQKWNHIITPLERILAIWGFYSLAYFILLPLGLYVISAQKRWKELLLVLCPILLLHGVYASFGNASKHFLYNAPFVIIAGVRALTWLQEKLQRRPALKWTVILLTILFMTISVRKQNLNMPWLQENPLHQAGIVAPLYSAERGATAYSIGIGAGYQIITNDEYMLATGHLFYSWYIHSIKHILGTWRAQQKAILDNVPTSNILTFEWGVSAPVAIDCMTEGNHFHQQKNLPEEYYFTISRPQSDLHFWRVVLPAGVRDRQEIESYIDSVSTLFLDGDQYVIAASNHYGTSHFLDEMSETGKLMKRADRLYQIKN